MRRTGILLAVVAGGSLTMSFVSTAFGHAHLVTPMRRAPCEGPAGVNDTTCKTAGPCGGTPNPAVTPTTFNVGSTVTLAWFETINHPSTYRISVSTNGGATQADFFTVMPESAVMDAGGGAYSWNWTVPPIQSCNPCVMQLVQSMDTNVGDFSNPYYNCADIRVLATGQTPAPTPTPSESPTPDDPGTPITVDGYGTSCSVSSTTVQALGPLAPIAVALLFLFGRRRRR